MLEMFLFQMLSTCDFNLQIMVPNLSLKILLWNQNSYSLVQNTTEMVSKSDLKECQQIFTFPYRKKDQPPTP